MVSKQVNPKPAARDLETRIDKGEFTAHSYPYPSAGVEILTIGESRLGERIWIGGIKHGVEVTHHLRFFALDDPAIRPDLFTAFRAIDGNHTVTEITHKLRIDLENFSRLLGFLEDEKLLHFSSIPHHIRNPFLDRSSSRTPSTRRDLEAHALPHGASFESRRSKSIIITSRSIIATSLASLLFGSGFTEIRFLDERVPNQSDQISDLDLGLSIFNGSDIGVERVERLAEIAHRSAILPLSEDRNAIAPDFRASLTIATTYPRPDHHQRWISEDRTFLIVPQPAQREIRIGPVVVPGATPCLRCHELNQMESNFWQGQVQQLQRLDPEGEVPRVAATLAASLAASFTLLWLDGDSEKHQHPLFGKQYILDLDSMESRVETWRHHPQCGCLGFQSHPSRTTHTSAPNSSIPSMNSRA